MISGYKNYIFDFDGTIASLDVDWKSLKVKVNSFCDNFSLDTNRSLNTKIDDLKNYIDIFSILKCYEQPGENINFIPQKKTIDFIKSIEKYYVISNNLNSTVLKTLTDLNIHKNCIQILGIDDIMQSKPNTEAYLKIRCSLEKGNSIYIGDRSSDNDFAINCSIDFYDIRK